MFKIIINSSSDAGLRMSPKGLSGNAVKKKILTSQKLGDKDSKKNRKKWFKLGERRIICAKEVNHFIYK